MIRLNNKDRAVSENLDDEFLKQLTKVARKIAYHKDKHYEYRQRIREFVNSTYSNIPCSVVDSLNKKEQNDFYEALFILLNYTNINSVQSELLVKVIKMCKNKKCDYEDSVLNKIKTNNTEFIKWFYGENNNNN